MALHSTVEAVQNDGAIRLAAFSHDSDANRNAIRHAGGILKVTAAMGLFPDGGALAEATRAAQSACDEYEDKIVAFHDADEPDDASLTRRLEVEYLGRQCAHATEARSRFAEEHSTVQINSCLALTELARDSRSNQDSIRTAEGIDRVTAAMVTLPDDYEMQYNGCLSLAVLAQENEQNQQAIVEARGIERVMSAMIAFADDVETQEYGCYALRELAHENPDVQAAILAAGAVEVIDAALRAVASGSIDDADDLVQQRCSDALRIQIV